MLFLAAGLAAAVVTLAVVAVHVTGARDRAVRDLNAATTRNIRLASQIAATQRHSQRVTAALHKAREQVLHTQSCGGGLPGTVPHGVVVPDHGPVGTRVSIVIDCLRGFQDEITQPAWVFLIRDFGGTLGCELMAGGPSRMRLLGQGRAAGWFTVSARGGCFQSQGKTRSVVPGTYGIGVGCHACEIANFTVTRS